MGPSCSELDFATLAVGRRFPVCETTVTSELVADYALALGVDDPVHRDRVPPGLAGILARRSYLQHHRMPPGGVLVAQSALWWSPAELESPLRLQATVCSRDRRGAHGVLGIETLVHQDDDLVAEIRTTISWP